MDIDGTLRLEGLTRAQAENWVDVAQMLVELETVSLASPSGRAWPDLLLERLEELGSPISISHLYKMRRGLSFLKAHAPAGTDMHKLRTVKVSAVEVAERLFRIDPEQGKKALEDALSGTPYIDLRARYKEALVSKPEMRSPRQLAWARRNSAPDAASDADPERKSRGKRQSRKMKGQGPSAALSGAIDELLMQAWSEGREEGLRRFKAELERRDAEIAKLQADISHYQQELREALEQGKLNYKAYRECMGDDHEVDWGKYMASDSVVPAS